MKIVDGIELMGRNEYKRHRGLESANSVTRAEESGRIPGAVVRDPDGKFIGINWRLADELWARNTDPTQAERTGAAPLNSIPLAPAPADVTESATNSGSQESRPAAPGPSVGEDLFKSAKDDHGYLEHRARTEEFKAKQAELDYLKELGLLVSAAESREANFRRNRMLRDQLLNIPDRIATIAAAERDPVRVHQIFTDELKRVLSELSIAATTEAAGGTAERVAA